MKSLAFSKIRTGSRLCDKHCISYLNGFWIENLNKNCIWWIANIVRRSRSFASTEQPNIFIYSKLCYNVFVKFLLEMERKSLSKGELLLFHRRKPIWFWEPCILWWSLSRVGMLGILMGILNQESWSDSWSRNAAVSIFLEHPYKECNLKNGYLSKLL